MSHHFHFPFAHANCTNPMKDLASLHFPTKSPNARASFLYILINYLFP